MEELYNNLWGQAGPGEVDLGEDLEPQISIGSILWPVKAEEVKEKLSRMASDVATGLDGVKRSHLAKRDVHTILAKWFNLLMIKMHFPRGWKSNQTTLIPKVGKDKGDVRNWRPITISLIISRIYSSLIDKRLRQNITQNSRQKGFTAENGCHINTATLNAGIRIAKYKGGTFGVTDLEKAFDTISHAAIGKALRRKRVPGQIADYVSDMFRGCSTRIRADGGDVEIGLQRGVKQGDPLSPLIFNLCIEPLLAMLQAQTRGICIDNGSKVSVLGFADDIVLLAKDTVSARKQFQLTFEYLEKLGMKLSIKKCNAFEIFTYRKTFLIRDPKIKAADKRIKYLKVDESLRYLGAKI